MVGMYTDHEQQPWLASLPTVKRIILTHLPIGMGLSKKPFSLYTLCGKIYDI